VVDAIVQATCISNFLQELGSEFKVRASGKLTWFLGCRVEQELEKDTVWLTQEKDCNDVMTQFQMADANAVHTPCESKQNQQAANSLPLDIREPNVVHEYQQAEGSYKILTVFTRGDCAFAVN